MKRLALLCVLAAVLSVGAWYESSRDAAVVHAETGPTIAAGTPTMSGGTVVVPINATGSGFSPFIAFDIHLRWDPANFTFLQATTNGGLFDNTASHVACSAYFADADGGGFVYDCYFDYNNTVATSPGLLALITLAPRQTGCSALHLVPFNAPGYYAFTDTISAYGNVQVNSYVDGSATETGAPCVAGTPTPGTPITAPTNTPTPTSLPGSTPTPEQLNNSVGPTISVGTPSISGGKFAVPIFASGAGFKPYIAFQVHLRWDPTIFQFDSVSLAGTVMDPATGRAYCVFGATNHLPDPDGGGMVLGCISLVGTTTSTGFLVTMNLAPLQFGCSALHLITEPPDSAGTQTYNADSSTQPNHLVDGATCNVAPPTATPTVTPTATATPVPGEAWMKSPAAGNVFLTTGMPSYSFDEIIVNQNDPNGLGGFSFDVHYDPTIFQQPAIDLAPAVALFASSGRVLSCAIGIPLNGLIHVACASTGTIGTGPVFGGPTVMAHVAMTPQSAIVEAIRPNKENGTVSVIKDDQVTVTNTCGQPLNDGSIQPVPGQPECQGVPLPGVGPGGVLDGNPNGGETTVTLRRLEGDITTDCKVDVVDMQVEASKFGLSVGSVLYNEFDDVNTPLQHGDGEIDINDIQFIFGRFGSTCQNPIPPQPPQPAP